MRRRSLSGSADLDAPLERADVQVRARLSVEFQMSRQEEQDRIDGIPAEDPVRQKRRDSMSTALLMYHEMEIDDVFRAFSIPSTSTGISGAEAAARLADNGPNLIKPPQPSIILKFLGYAFGGFNIMLLICAILAIIAWRIGDPPDGTNMGYGNLD